MSKAGIWAFGDSTDERFSTHTSEDCDFPWCSRHWKRWGMTHTRGGAVVILVQATAEMVSGDEAAREVWFRYGGSTELSDGAARAIAAEWVSGGTYASYLHRLSMGMPTPLTAILDDIRGVRAGVTAPAVLNALDMLATWAIAASKRPLIMAPDPLRGFTPELMQAMRPMTDSGPIVLDSAGGEVVPAHPLVADRMNPDRAFNDPIVDCCERDAADCDCPEPEKEGPMPKISEASRYTVDTHTVKKNTIIVKYLKGEHEATAVVHLARTGDTERTRRGNAENLARSLAIEAWEREWGDLCHDWGMVQAVVSHTTIQVVYSLRVSTL